MAYEVRQTPDFAKWHSGLKDHVAQDAITARLLRMQAGLIGKAKSVGGKVAEAVVDTGPGYRLYYTRRGLTLIVMQGGGDKSTQQADIAAAQAMAKTMDQAAKSESKTPKGKAKRT